MILSESRVDQRQLMIHVDSAIRASTRLNHYRLEAEVQPSAESLTVFLTEKTQGPQNPGRAMYVGPIDVGCDCPANVLEVVA